VAQEPRLRTCRACAFGETLWSQRHGCGLADDRGGGRILRPCWRRVHRTRSPSCGNHHAHPTLPPVWSRTDLARRRVSRVPVLPADGWHLALMGGIGTAVLAELSIAGLLHAGLTLPVGYEVNVAIFFRLISVFLRILPELAELSAIASHVSASIFWAAGFGLWLWRYYPNFDRPRHA